MNFVEIEYAYNVYSNCYVLCFTFLSVDCICMYKIDDKNACGHQCLNENNNQLYWWLYSLFLSAMLFNSRCCCCCCFFTGCMHCTALHGSVYIYFTLRLFPIYTCMCVRVRRRTSNIFTLNWYQFQITLQARVDLVARHEVYTCMCKVFGCISLDEADTYYQSHGCFSGN